MFPKFISMDPCPSLMRSSSVIPAQNVLCSTTPPMPNTFSPYHGFLSILLWFIHLFIVYCLFLTNEYKFHESRKFVLSVLYSWCQEQYLSHSKSQDNICRINKQYTVIWSGINCEKIYIEHSNVSKCHNQLCQNFKFLPCFVSFIIFKYNEIYYKKGKVTKVQNKNEIILMSMRWVGGTPESIMKLLQLTQLENVENMNQIWQR